HFLEVAEHGGLPLVLYNVPSRTACDLLPETMAQLAGHPAIVGIKEARADAERIAALAELARPDFVYLSGDDGTAGQAMLAGAAVPCRWWRTWCPRRSARCATRPPAAIAQPPRVAGMPWRRCCKRWTAHRTRSR